MINQEENEELHRIEITLEGKEILDEGPWMQEEITAIVELWTRPDRDGIEQVVSAEVVDSCIWLIDQDGGTVMEMPYEDEDKLLIEAAVDKLYSR